MVASPTTCGQGAAAAGNANSTTSNSLPSVKAVAGSCAAPASSVPGIERHGRRSNNPPLVGAQRDTAAAAAGASTTTAGAAVMPSISGSGGGGKGKHVASGPVRGDNAGAGTAAATTGPTTETSVSFGGSSAAEGDAAASRSSSSTHPRSSGGVNCAGPGAAQPASGGKTSKRISGGETVRRGSVMAALDRGFSGSNGAFGGQGSGGAGGVGGAGGGGKSRRRGKRDSPGEGSSRGSMDTLTTTSVSTVTRGVALQWKPRLNVELGSFVYPSLMLEKSDVCLQPEDSAPYLDGAGGSRRRLIAGKSGNGLHKIGRQQTKRTRSLVPGGGGGGDPFSGGPESKSSRSPGGRVGTGSDSTTLPPLTWVLSAEPDQPPSGVLTLQFHWDDSNGSGGGMAPFEKSRESSFNGSLSEANRSGVEGGWRGSDEFTNPSLSLSSSKWSSSSFAECLRAGEVKLREEVRRLHRELKQVSGDGKKTMTGSGALAAQARSIITNDKTRSVAALMAVKGRASAVQYEKLVNRPGKAWTKATRIVSRMTPSEIRDFKNREKCEMRAEMKRLEKERHDEEDRRLAREFEERTLKAKMTNSGGRLKKIIPVEEKLQAKDSYFSQFHQAARTRYGGHFDGGVLGASTDRPPTGATGSRLGVDSSGGHRGIATSSRPGSSSSRPSSRGRGSVLSPSRSRSQSTRPGSPGSLVLPQASDGSKRQAMARDVFIVACLELGLHPDLSQVRWNLGCIDLAHFGLGDQLVAALAASLKYSPPESLSLRDNRMTDGPLGVVVSSLDVDSLVRLDLSENRVGPKAMKALCSFLEGGSCLETLILTATQIGDAEIAPLSETLMENEVLLSLNLSRNHLRSAGASRLAKILSSSSCGLQHLDISWNCCSGAGTVELGEALKHQTSLRTLELAFNSFSDDGTMALAIALLDNHQLTSLGLSWNRVGGAASIALSRMLSHNSALRKLDLGGNPLTETGGRSIVRALIVGSGCDVGMRDCSFREDTDILFDRNYPPPLISLDLDLKNPFQCCVLHELIGLAQAKPGSKFVEVYRHAGGGRGRTPVNLQVL
eukprot:g14129.t3